MLRRGRNSTRTWYTEPPRNPLDTDCMYDAGSEGHSITLADRCALRTPTPLPDAARHGNGSAVTPTRVHTVGGEHTEGCSCQGGDPADEDWGADADRVGDRTEDRSADRCGAHKENGL